MHPKHADGIANSVGPDHIWSESTMLAQRYIWKFRIILVVHIWAASWQNQRNGMCAQHPPSLMGGCPSWSESLLGAHAILLVLSWGCSFYWKINPNVVSVKINPDVVSVKIKKYEELPVAVTTPPSGAERNKQKMPQTKYNKKHDQCTCYTRQESREIIYLCSLTFHQAFSFFFRNV